MVILSFVLFIILLVGLCWVVARPELFWYAYNKVRGRSHIYGIVSGHISQLGEEQGGPVRASTIMIVDYGNGREGTIDTRIEDDQVHIMLHDKNVRLDNASIVLVQKIAFFCYDNEGYSFAEAVAAIAEG